MFRVFKKNLNPVLLRLIRGDTEVFCLSNFLSLYEACIENSKKLPLFRNSELNNWSLIRSVGLKIIQNDYLCAKDFELLFSNEGYKKNRKTLVDSGLEEKVFLGLKEATLSLTFSKRVEVATLLKNYEVLGIKDVSLFIQIGSSIEPDFCNKQVEKALQVFSTKKVPSRQDISDISEIFRKFNHEPFSVQWYDTTFNFLSCKENLRC